MYNNTPDLSKMVNDTKKSQYPGGRVFIITMVIVLFVSVYATYKLGWASKEIDIENDKDRIANFISPSKSKIPDILKNDSDYVMPEKEKNRLDILILGIRGDSDENAQEAGAYLTDTILVLSYDKETKKGSMVSIPRDLYVRVAKNREDKINAVYEMGLINGNSLTYTKNLFSQITGVYIDNIVIFDFIAFKKIVDDLGGVDIKLAKPFTENNQWGYEFNLPAGDNHLDGQTALYYVRSRFSSSDFDRAQRQQTLMLAIKEKALSLNILTDPITIINLIGTIKNNMRTDIDILDAKSLLGLAQNVADAGSNIKRYAINTDNLVYESKIENIYILLPQGDNFANIKSKFKEILK